MIYLKSLALSCLRNSIAKLDVLGVNTTLRSFSLSNAIYDQLIQAELNPYSSSFAHFKTSDTLFILGSGPSISLITDYQWDFISLHNSAAFNRWFYHPFVPDFYFFAGDGGANPRLTASEGKVN